MLKVWIAGANGQIGRALNDVLDPMQIETLNTDLDELDITDTDEVINFGSINRPDVIINCTGITDTDECEKNPEHAYRVNALGARNLSIVQENAGQRSSSFPQMMFSTERAKNRIQSLTIPIR